MPFDHNSKGVRTFSYIIVNRYLGTRTHINTYNGMTGTGFNAGPGPGTATYALKGETPEEREKDLRLKLRLGKEDAYSRCLIADCPAAVLAFPPEGWTGEVITEPPLES